MTENSSNHGLLPPKGESNNLQEPLPPRNEPDSSVKTRSIIFIVVGLTQLLNGPTMYFRGMREYNTNIASGLMEQPNYMDLYFGAGAFFLGVWALTAGIIFLTKKPESISFKTMMKIGIIPLILFLLSVMNIATMNSHKGILVTFLG